MTEKSGGTMVRVIESIAALVLTATLVIPLVVLVLTRG
jgi:hypothetical protein